jgi:hypothetical protein
MHALRAAAAHVSDSHPPDPSALVPQIGTRVSLPAHFGRRFVILADAEEEFDWTKPFSRENVSTSAISALPDATARFNAAGVIPSYLLDYPVVANAESATIIRSMVEADVCDIGAQLHPWVTPPYDEDINNTNSFTGNLPLELQRAKLLALTTAITSATGLRPVVHRAGRYGLGAHTMQLLTEAGYEMDVSVRSRWDYSDHAGVNYERHPLWLWRVNQQLIELPLSTAWTGMLRRTPPLSAFNKLSGILARTGMLSRIPLTPEGIPLRDAIEAIHALADEGLDIFSFSFHTPSVMIGHTPYVRDQHDLATFWDWWDGVFNVLAKLGIKPARQGEIIAAAKEG